MAIQTNYPIVHCNWVKLEYSLYETGCGNIQNFTHDGVEENEYKFCPYCGRFIVEQEFNGSNPEVKK